LRKAFDPRWQEATLERALSGASAPVRAMLESVLGGAELGCGEGIALTAVEGADLLALVKTADELRRRAIGDTITYVVNRNLNFTNVCIVGCAFCGFSRKPGDADAYFHSHESLIARAREAQERGATEVCIQGGLPRELDGYYYRDLLRAIKAELPEMHVHAFSPMEIAYGIEKTRLPMREYLLALKESGLGSIPGRRLRFWMILCAAT